jgi:CubicO group peptidase (beta-lactamase class C family)
VENISDDSIGCDGARHDSVATSLRTRTSAPRHGNARTGGDVARAPWAHYLNAKEEIADGKLPGAVVMVARKGKIVYSDAIGFQDKGANTPMKPDSIFRIYSMTKPLVSVAAMMLVEDGVIQLTDPISNSCQPSRTCK